MIRVVPAPDKSAIDPINRMNQQHGGDGDDQGPIIDESDSTMEELLEQVEDHAAPDDAAKSRIQTLSKSFGCLDSMNTGHDSFALQFNPTAAGGDESVLDITPTTTGGASDDKIDSSGGGPVRDARRQQQRHLNSKQRSMRDNFSKSMTDFELGPANNNDSTADGKDGNAGNRRNTRKGSSGVGESTRQRRTRRPNGPSSSNSSIHRGERERDRDRDRRRDRGERERDRDRGERERERGDRERDRDRGERNRDRGDKDRARERNREHRDRREHREHRDRERDREHNRERKDRSPQHNHARRAGRGAGGDRSQRTRPNASHSSEDSSSQALRPPSVSDADDRSESQRPDDASVQDSSRKLSSSTRRERRRQPPGRSKSAMDSRPPMDSRPTTSKDDMAESNRRRAPRSRGGLTKSKSGGIDLDVMREAASSRAVPPAVPRRGGRRRPVARASMSRSDHSPPRNNLMMALSGKALGINRNGEDEEEEEDDEPAFHMSYSDHFLVKKASNDAKNALQYESEGESECASFYESEAGGGDGGASDNEKEKPKDKKILGMSLKDKLESQHSEGGGGRRRRLSIGSVGSEASRSSIRSASKKVLSLLKGKGKKDRKHQLLDDDDSLTSDEEMNF